MRFQNVLMGFVLAAVTMTHTPAQTRVDLRTQTKNVDFSNANSTKPSKTGTALPSTCSVGETFFKTDAQPGQNQYACTSANVWTLEGQSPNYSAPFTSATTVSIPGNVHKLGTANLLVQVYDNQTPAWHVEPDHVWIDPSTYNVTVTFSAPQSGRVVINSGGGAGGGGPNLPTQSGGTAPSNLTGTATLHFSVIPYPGCGELTFALPGAVGGDGIAAGWPGGLESGLIGMMRVTAADTVAVRLCNLSGAALSPASASFRAAIIRNSP